MTRKEKEVFKSDWYMAIKKIWGKEEFEVILTNLRHSNVFKVYGTYNNLKDAKEGLNTLKEMSEEDLKVMFKDKNRSWVTFSKPITIIEWKD